MSKALTPLRTEWDRLCKDVLGRPKGGNTTRGADRKGQKGRPPAYPADAGVQLVAIKLSERHRALAVYLGFGVTPDTSRSPNVAAGVRAALTALAQLLKNAPPDMYVATLSGTVHQHKPGEASRRAKTRADVQQALKFLERAAEDSPAGAARARELPRCYDHPEHDPECAACREAAAESQNQEAPK